MKQLLILVGVVVLILGGIRFRSELAFRFFQATGNLEDQAYSCIMSKVKLEGIEGRPLVVQDQSEAYPYREEEAEREGEYLRKKLPGVKPETLDDYSRKRDSIRTFDTPLRFHRKAAFATRQELAERNERQPKMGLREIVERFRGDEFIFWFSRVGFSADGKQALVYMGYSCGGLCGQGNFYLLEMHGGEWVIRNHVMCWIA